VLARSEILPTSNSTNDQKGLFSLGDCVRQRGIARFMGEVLLAGEKPQEGQPLVRDMVADHRTESGIVRLQRIQDGSLDRGTFDFGPTSPSNSTSPRR